MTDRASCSTAGGGGVNTAAIQMCRTLTPNSRIIVTASTGKVQRVEELGADFVIDYKKQDFAEEIRRYTKDEGVDLILDHLGAKYLAPNMRSLALEGKLIVIGLMGGVKAELNLGIMMVKRQRIIGSVLRSRSVQEKGEITALFTQKVLPLIADGTLVPAIHEVFPLEEVREAHKCMEESRHFGKIVLRVSA